MSKSKIAQWWNRFFWQPLKKQLTQGVSVNKLSLTVTLGVLVGIFPIMGTPGTLCIATGALLKLNQPILFAFKTLVLPLHLGLILVFIRFGETLNGADHIAFTVPEMLEMFKENPAQFAKDFAASALFAIEAWLLVAPFAGAILYFTTRSILSTASKKMVST